MEGGELDRVAVDLAEVEVGAHACNVRSGNVVGCAPDAGRGWVLGGCQVVL